MGRSNSLMWDQLGFNDRGNEQRHVACKTFFVVVASQTGNTTNLFNNLKCNHHIIYDKLMRKQYRVLWQNPFTQGIPTLHQRRKKITYSIANYLAEGMCSINTTDQSFRLMVNMLDNSHSSASNLCLCNAALHLFTKANQLISYFCTIHLIFVVDSFFFFNSTLQFQSNIPHASYFPFYLFIYQVNCSFFFIQTKTHYSIT